MQLSSDRGAATNESDCMALIAETFAGRGDWSRSVEVAAMVSDGDERYRAYSRIALGQRDAGLNQDAFELVARQMREVKLQNTRTAKDEGLSIALDLLIESRHVAEAEEALKSIESEWSRASVGQRIVGTLIEAGEYARAETFAQGLPKSNRALALVAIARKQGADGSAETVNTLDRAHEIAKTLEEGGERSNVLREICWADYELKGGRQAVLDTMHEAAAALNQAKTFRVRPTPWPDMFLLMAKVGEWQSMQGWLKGLVDFDPFDGCVALLNLAEYAWQSGDQERVNDLMIKARDAADRTTFPPMQSQCYANIVQLFAKMGRFEEAQNKELIEAADRASRGTAMQYVAEELANAGRIDEAYEAIKFAESPSMSLVDATIRAAELSRALEYVNKFEDSSKKADGLARLASAFAAEGDRAQALSLLSEALVLPEDQQTGSHLADIAKRYVAMEERQLATSMVAGEWRHASSRRILINRLAAGSELLSEVPSLGIDVYRSFGWVEEFLAM
jgi:tetratricopeptide (TPR) repeat protein